MLFYASQKTDAQLICQTKKPEILPTEEMLFEFFPAVAQDARHGLFKDDLLPIRLPTILFCAKQTASFLCETWLVLSPRIFK